MRYHVSLAGLVVSVCVMASDAVAQEAELAWSDKVGADHPAFADAATSMARGDVTLEKGFEGSRLAAGEGLQLGGAFLARAGMPGDFELRLKLPSASFLFSGREEGGGFALPAFELGARKSFAPHERFLLGVTPHLIVPSGLDSSEIGGLSGQLGLVTNWLIPQHDTTLWLAATPRYLAIKTSERGEPRQTSAAFELDVALGLSRDFSKRISAFIETWGVAALNNERGYTPAGDLGVVYYLTPDFMADAYLGVIVTPQGLAPYGGIGMTFRRRFRRDQQPLTGTAALQTSSPQHAAHAPHAR